MHVIRTTRRPHRDARSPAGGRASNCVTHGALQGSRVRPGLTLLELMIALSLLSVLILVAWSLFNSLAMVDEKGQAQIKRVQVLRGIQSILAEDINARFRETPQEFTPQPSGQASLSLGDLTRAQQGSDGDLSSLGLSPAPPTEIHFVGTAQSLEFSLMSPPTIREHIESQETSDPGNRVLDGSALYESDPGGNEDSFDQSLNADVGPDRSVRSNPTHPAMQKVTVKYRFSRTADGETGGLTRALSGRAQQSSSSSASRATLSPTSADRVLDASDLYGLSETDEMDTSNGELTSRTSTLSQKQVEFPEVGEVQFRYHDGSQWLQEWNAQEMGSYPAAIEIQFELLTNVELREIRQGAAERAESNAISELDELNADPSVEEEPLDFELDSALEAPVSANGETGIRLPYRVIVPVDPHVAKELLRQRLPPDDAMRQRGGRR